MIIMRYADDVVVGFEHESDARRFLDAMRARLEEFALSLHPEKTRLIEFGRHAATDRKQQGFGKPETFTFLGFMFNRPIVVTPKGVRLCRPSELVLDMLEKPLLVDFIKEDGERVAARPT